MSLNDPIGQAVLAYFNTKDKTPITVMSSISEDDIIPVEYLFRVWDDMPVIEKTALNLCKGKILDVGAGAGCHSLVLKDKNLLVDAIDTSAGAVETMLKQGLKAQQVNFYSVTEKYDTLLFLMNGVGIAGTLDNLPHFFKHAAALLKPNGQILLDSSDISYMYKEEDGSVWQDLNTTYYGNVHYQITYKKHKSDKFNWLFVDFDRLNQYAKQCGFKCELVVEGLHYDYLARLTYL